MTQSTYSNATDSHEVEPRLVFENLPPDVRHRVSQLKNASLAVEQLYVAEALAPKPYKTPVPFDIETALANAEAASVQPSAEVPAESHDPQPENVVPIEQGRAVKERKMVENPITASSQLEELRRQVWNAYDDEPHVRNIFFEDGEAA